MLPSVDIRGSGELQAWPVDKQLREAWASAYGTFQAPRARQQDGSEASFGLLVTARQHTLCILDALAQALLKRGVVLALLDMSRDCCPYDLRKRLAINGRYSIQLLRLLGGQANCHCLDRFHGAHCPIDCNGCQASIIRGIMVS